MEPSGHVWPVKGIVYFSSGLVVYNFVLLGAYGICEASPSDCVADWPLYLAAYFAAFNCFHQNGPFPGLHRSSSPSGFMQIPTQCLFFSRFSPLPQSLSDQSPFLTLICSKTGFFPVALTARYYFPILVTILDHLMRVILHKYLSTNACYFLIISTVTFQVSHPYVSTGLINIADPSGRAV